MSLPELSQFRPVTMADRAELERLLAENDALFCDYNFANLFMWGDLFRISWLHHGGRVWIHNGRESVLLMPLGEPVPAAELHEMCLAWRSRGHACTVALADDEYVRGQPGLDALFRVEADDANSDYVYLTQKLAELRGNKLSRKRNLISQFQALFPDARTLPLAPADCGSCLDLAEKWCRMRNCRSLGFDPEEAALKRGLENFAGLGLAGLKLMVGDRLIAFSIWTALNPETADIHFEKFDPEVKGAAQVINQRTAQELVGRFKHLNREQDMGMEGLRRAKLSYYPEYILRAHTLRLHP